MSCRLPGANRPEELWDVLSEGRHTVGEVPDDRYDIDDWYDPEPRTLGRITSRNGGFIDNVDAFDAGFFGISPREAESMDPQQRVMLEVAWEAVEDAGIARAAFGRQRAGAFLAVGQDDYWDMLRRNGKLEVYGLTGAGERSMAAGRLAYFLDLRGPVATVDTACSSSLLAVHMACESLRTEQCDIAFAGGVNLILTPEYAAALSHGGMLSTRGSCRFGDSSADGYVRSEGAGVVLLKPLANALRDGDHVHAVISGGAVMNDGASGLHLLNPGEPVQRELLRAAYRQAGADPSKIDYIEAHGTGTVEGDQVELRALRDVVGPGRPADSPCLVGSVKSNVGHTEHAAGVIGLIKTALALRHRRIPASLHADDPRPELTAEDSPVRLATRLQHWPERSTRPLAGVSAFGLSGTSVHLVLTAAPPQRRSLRRPVAGPFLLPLSARTPEALPELAARYARRLETADEAELRDVCWSAGTRRSHHPYRVAVLGDTPAQLVTELRRLAGLDSGLAAPDSPEPRGVTLSGAGRLSPRPTRVVFVCPGQGSQWDGMARELLASSAAFREAMAQCDVAVRAETGWSVLDRIEDGEWPTIDVLQPVLWAIEVSLARVWQSWGVQPDLVIGHSMGEAAAAAVSGALSLADAAAVICRRSRLLAGLGGRGAMAVVQLSAEAATGFLWDVADRVSVAAGNSPTSTVLAGEPEALEQVLDRVRGQGVFARRVNVDVASHSPQVDPCLIELAAQLATIAPRPGLVPLHSTVLDEQLTGEELDADYWVRNLRNPVLFGQSVRSVLADGDPVVFIELSANPVLLAPIRDVIEDGARATMSVATASMRSDQPQSLQLLTALGSAYVHGCVPDWDAVVPGGRRTDLPVYPWQHERYWLELAPAPEPTSRWGDPQPHPLIGLPVPAAFANLRVWSLDVAADPNVWAPGPDHETRPLPASVHLEAAFAAVHQIVGPRAVAVENFRHHTLLEPADLAQIRVALTERPGGWHLQVTAYHPDDEDGRPDVVLASGAVRLIEGQGEDHSGSLAAVRRWCTTHEPGTDQLSDPGRSLGRFGPDFRVIREVWRREGEALVQLSYRARGTGELSRYRGHPVAMETFAALLTATLPPAARVGLGPLVLSGADAVRLFRQPDREMWCHARLTGIDNGVTGDVRVLDRDGRLVAELSGLRLRPKADHPGLARSAEAAGSFGPHRQRSEGFGDRVIPLPLERTGRMESVIGTGIDAGIETGPDLLANLTNLAAGLLRLSASRIDPYQPLTVLGLDSMMSVQLARAVEAMYDVPVPARDLLAGGTLQDLVTLVTRPRDPDALLRGPTALAGATAISAT
jgi:phthiocerol/phenolphthiocerol synthesis type-I polyketide synthase C